LTGNPLDAEKRLKRGGTPESILGPIALFEAKKEHLNY
jgi:hypothetical protein